MSVWALSVSELVGALLLLVEGWFGGRFVWSRTAALASRLSFCSGSVSFSLRFLAGPSQRSKVAPFGPSDCEALWFDEPFADG